MKMIKSNVLFLSLALSVLTIAGGCAQPADKTAAEPLASVPAPAEKTLSVKQQIDKYMKDARILRDNKKNPVRASWYLLGNTLLKDSKYNPMSGKTAFASIQEEDAARAKENFIWTVQAVNEMKLSPAEFSGLSLFLLEQAVETQQDFSLAEAYAESLLKREDVGARTKLDVFSILVRCKLNIPDVDAAEKVVDRMEKTIPVGKLLSYERCNMLYLRAHVMALKGNVDAAVNYLLPYMDDASLKSDLTVKIATLYLSC